MGCPFFVMCVGKLFKRNKVQEDRRMTRIIIEVEFEIDDSWCANSKYQEEREWFWNYVIPSCMVILHNNEIGDTVSETKTFDIKKITFNTKEN